LGVQNHQGNLAPGAAGNPQDFEDDGDGGKGTVGVGEPLLKNSCTIQALDVK